MTLQELQQQVLGLSASDRWQLVQWLLSLLKRESLPETTTTSAANTYPLRGLPLQMSDDFDDPMSELWDALGQ